MEYRVVDEGRRGCNGVGGVGDHEMGWDWSGNCKPEHHAGDNDKTSSHCGVVLVPMFTVDPGSGA